MKKYIVKTLCIGLTMLMLLPMFSACAESFTAATKVYIISNTLNAYKYKSTSSKVLGVMTYGEEMTMLDFDGDWVKIRNAKGQIGYCGLGGLSSKNPNTISETVYAKANGTPVYQKASASYKKLATVRQNYKFNVVAKTPDGKWLRVKNGRIYGYVQLDHVSKNQSSSHGAILKKTVWVVSDNAVQVTSGLGTGRRMGLISHGQSFTLLGTSGKYAKIKNSSGRIGWCPSEILSTDNPNSENATMYAQVSGSYLYPHSIFSGTPRAIRQGTKVTLVAETPDGGWSRVKYGGRYYYVQSVLLSDEPAPAEGRAVYSKADAALYAKASYSSQKLADIEAYEELQLLGVSKQGARVRTVFGKTGYLPIELLEPSVWTFAAPRR